MALDIDQVFEQIGSMGYYQLTLAFLLSYIVFSDTFHILDVSYTALEPPWKCVSSSMACNLTGLMKPGDEHYEYRCEIPRSEWEFSADYTTIVTEWDLVCDYSILGSVATSLIFPGWIIGMLLCGTISDRYGRKPVLFATFFLPTIVGFISAFSPTFWFFALCRFIIGFGIGGSLNSAYIISMEFVGIRHRALMTTLSGLGWIIAGVMLPMIAYSFPKWPQCTLAAALSGLPVMFMWWYVSESPRWLLVEGKHDQVKEVLYQIARSNGREMPKQDIALTHKKPENSRNGNTKDLFRNWTIAKTTLIMFLAWFSVAQLSYATIFASVTIGGNMYLTFSILNLPNMLSPPFNVWFMNKFGRKKGIFAGLTLAAVAGGCLITISSDDETLGATVGRIGLFIVIRISTSLAWSSVFLLTGEVFPTMTRNVGLAWCSTMARLGAGSAPYVLWLQRYNPGVPMSLMATMSLTAAFLTIFVKETTMIPTKETVAEIDIEAEININEQNNEIVNEMEGKANEGFELTRM